LPRKALRIGAGILLLAGAGAIAYAALRPVPPRPIVGMVRATEVKITPEVSGRIVSLPVTVGERIAAGTTVVELANPELAAAVGEAEAALLEAKAARDRVYAGVRHEEVGIAAQNIAKARADLALAQKQLARIAKLAMLPSSSSTTPMPPSPTQARLSRPRNRRMPRPRRVQPSRSAPSPMPRSKSRRRRSRSWNGASKSWRSARLPRAWSRPWWASWVRRRCRAGPC